VPAKRPDDKGKSRQGLPAKHEAHTAEVAFEEVIDAILGADPEAMREHKAQRRRRGDNQAYAADENRKGHNNNPKVSKPRR
jgi:hypothetical protein